MKLHHLVRLSLFILFAAVVGISSMQSSTSLAADGSVADGSGAGAPKEALPDTSSPPAPTTPATTTQTTTLDAARKYVLTADLQGLRQAAMLEFLAEPGAMLKEGDVVAAFEFPKDFEQDIARAGQRVEYHRIQHMIAKNKIEGLAKEREFSLERARFDLQVAENALRRFEQEGRADTLRRAELDHQGSVDRLEDEEEELRQLKKLYEGHDLAKESQDIVVHRTERSIARMKIFLDISARNLEYTKTIGIHEQEQSLRFQAHNARKRLEDAANDATWAGHHMALLKAEMDLREAEKAMSDIQELAEKRTLRAPASGMFVSGPLNNNDGVSPAMMKGDRVNHGAAVGAILASGALVGVVEAPIEQIAAWKSATSVTVTQEAVKVSTRGRVVSLSRLARNGKIAVRIEIPNADGALLAGMSVNVLPSEDE